MNVSKRATVGQPRRLRRYSTALSHVLQELEVRWLLSQTTWTGAIDNNFWTVGNWDSGLPSATVAALFDASPANPITMGAPPGDPARIIDDLIVEGSGTTVVLNVMANNTVENTLIVDEGAHLTITNGDFWTNGPKQLDVDLLISVDGQLDITQVLVDCEFLSVGIGSSIGTLNVSDWAHLTAHNDTVFGWGCVASVSFSTGAVVNSLDGAKLDGGVPGLLATLVTVDGANWNIGGLDLTVDEANELLVRNGGLIDVSTTTNGLKLYGRLTGDGTVIGNVTAYAEAILHAGWSYDYMTSIGWLLIDGNLNMTNGGKIESYFDDLDGNSNAIVVLGTATLDGDLDWTLINYDAITPDPQFTVGQNFALIVADSFSGSFDSYAIDMETDFHVEGGVWGVATIDARINGTPPGTELYDLDEGSDHALVLRLIGGYE